MKKILIPTGIIIIIATTVLIFLSSKDNFRETVDIAPPLNNNGENNIDSIEDLDINNPETMINIEFSGREMYLKKPSIATETNTNTGVIEAPNTVSDVPNTVSDETRFTKEELEKIDKDIELLIAEMKQKNELPEGPDQTEEFLELVELEGGITLNKATTGDLALSPGSLPFGGRIVYATPCTCSFGVWLIIVFDYRTMSPLNLVYIPGVSMLYAYYNIFTPGPSILGTYTPSSGQCWFYVGLGCSPYPTIGNLNFLPGTGVSVR